MLKNGKYLELESMYELYQWVDSTLKYMIDEMIPYIEEQGKVIVLDVELRKNHVDMILQILELRTRIDDLVKNSFHDHAKFT